MLPLYIIFGIILLFIAVILIRTLAFRPKEGPKIDEYEVTVDTDRIVERLRRLVRFKTVSYRDRSLEDDKEFEGLISALPELYPSVFKACELTRFEGRGLLFKWSGKTEGEPTVLMAHYDVVPVVEEGWDKPPF